MAISRYDIRKIVANNAELYSEHLQKRNLNFINHYTTPEIIKNALVNNKDLIYSYHIWAVGDKLYKLAHKFYGDSSLWWVIGLVNQKPTESHFKLGDVVLIPQPLHKVLDLFGV